MANIGAWQFELKRLYIYSMLYLGFIIGLNLTGVKSADAQEDTRDAFWLVSDYQVVFQSFRNGDFSSSIMAVSPDRSKERRLSPYAEGRPGCMDPFVSHDYSKIVFTLASGGSSHRTSLGIMNADGSGLRKLTDEIATRFRGGWMTPSISREGRIAFVSNKHGNDDIFLIDSDGKNMRQITRNSGENTWPRWSSDGSEILFVSTRDGNKEIYTMQSDGTAPKRLTTHNAVDTHPSWSSDGSGILFMSERDGNREIYSMRADGTGQTRLTRTSEDEILPVMSPDGRLIAYVAKPDNPAKDYMRSIFVMTPDGRRHHAVSSPAYHDGVPSWIKAF